MQSRRTRRARIGTLAEWFSEISALLAILPIIDQLDRARFNWTMVAGTTISAAFFLGVGVYLTKGVK